MRSSRSNSHAYMYATTPAIMMMAATARPVLTLTLAPSIRYGMQEEKQKLELERLLWESQQKMATQLITPNKQIKLNIGGEVFFTSIETLRKYPNCTLCLIFTSHYFCSLPPEQQEKGYFIDRDAKHFRLILNFLRTGAMVWPESAGDRKELMLECEFYNLLDYVSLLPRKEFCRSASKIFGRYCASSPPSQSLSSVLFSVLTAVCVCVSPLECDEDYRKITFHFDSSFLFLLSSTCADWLEARKTMRQLCSHTSVACAQFRSPLISPTRRRSFTCSRSATATRNPSPSSSSTRTSSPLVSLPLKRYSGRVVDSS